MPEATKNEAKDPGADLQIEERERIRLQILQLAREVPAGRVISYGALGKRSEPPVSGYICGRILALAMGDVPWWRVVGKDGKLPIGKRGPEMAARQREMLSQEGIKFDSNGAILPSYFTDASEPASK